LTEGAGSGAGLIQPHYLPGIVESVTRRLTVAELFAAAPTDSAAIQFMRETSFVNAAAGVEEAGLKPESGLVFAATTSPTRKIAHWIPVAEEILEDQPLIASYVDGRLRHGVELRLDDALLNGSGVSPELEGILQRDGLAAPIARTTQTNSDAIAAQIAAIEQTTMLQVDAIILNPQNWLAIQLLKNADGNYISGSGPVGPAQPQMLWGRRVVITPVIAVNTALVGCFQTAATLFYRGGLKVEATNSHENFFVTNKIAVRAEIRTNLVVFREAAFGLVTGLSA
jgi:HK97 family phage major capsid protein